jgi:ubiquinone/menaquinone biosynthesis C-methylase UbiE
MKPSMIPDAKRAVRQYWDAAPSGSSLTNAEPGSKAFFDEIEASRYRLEPFIPKFAEFERWRNKRVLEIGVGLGTDLVRFARGGANLSGIDLTEAAIDLVRRRLALENLDANLRVADAEALPFADESFDLVYSWGVLHHTPDTERAISEIWRVLRPGGETRVMLYSRRSWVALGAWARYALLRGRPWRSFGSVLAAHMESVGTKAYTQPELEEMFSRFSSVSFTRFVTPYDRRVSGSLARVTGPRFGWFVGTSAQRPH